MRWHVLGEISGRQAFADLTDPTLTEADLPASFSASSEWTDDCDLCPFYDGCQVAGATCDGPPAVPDELVGLGRPVIYGGFTEGRFSGGAERFVVDTLTRSQSGSGTSLGDSTLGGPVEVVSGGVGVATWDWAPDLTTSLGLPEWNGHLSSAVRLDWGGDNDIQVLWSLEDGEGLQLSDVAGLGAYTHVSLRIGNVVEGDAGCDQAQSELSFDEVEGDLRLHYRDAGGVDQTTDWTSIGVLVDPQRPYQFQPPSNGGGFACDAVQFMHTVRLPLADYCDTDGLAAENLSGVELRLHDKGVTQHAIVDSIEFTRDPTAAETATCPTKTSGWNCYAASTFTATETSCKDEPTPGCAGTDIVTNPVDPPWVGNPGSGGFDGWVAHMPAGTISDPFNPTQTDLDRVTDACVEACALEWSDNPDVDATCNAATFSGVSLRQTPDRGPVQRIPASQETGGFFGGQQLSCNLESDCCLEFDEDLCRARPSRPTSAMIPVGVGEEYRVSFSAVSKATFTTPGGSVHTPMAGEAGYSHCADPGAGTCAFYLGSANASATSSVTVSDSCPDSSSFSAVISDLDVELLQPAFGQADSSPYDKVMPVGALLLQGTITIDGNTYTIHATNEDPVYLSAAGGWLFAMDMEVKFDVPCGGGTIPLTLEFDLQRGSTLDSPPSVSITVPSTLSCPTIVPLSVNVSDPDSDLESVRWYVDDVLISPTLSTLPITTGHVLRAVARDERGATSTAVKTVSCR